MSKIAADALLAAGYTNLYDLEGGMQAWEATGKPLVHRPEHA
jgi:rhodanese-related sulfurtransferase